LSAPLAAAPPFVRRAPLVHAPWTHAWWQGRADLVELFGPSPSPASLAAAAATQSRRVLPAWTSWVRSAAGHAPPADALVVLAGQQPVLAGGAALVAHKAATAVRLARDLSASLRRPVVPVFLLADEDHDSSEVDHVDVVADASGRVLGDAIPVALLILPVRQIVWVRFRCKKRFGNGWRSRKQLSKQLRSVRGMGCAPDLDGPIR